MELCLCSRVLWKVEFVSNNIYLAETISKQGVEGMMQLLLTAYSKKWEERINLKSELLIKSEAKLKRFGNLSALWWRMTKRPNEELSMDQPPRQNTEVILQNDERITRRQFRDLQGFPSHHSSRVQGLGTQQFQRRSPWCLQGLGASASTISHHRLHSLHSCHASQMPQV